MNILVSGIASDIGYNVAKILKSNQISNYIFGIDIINKIYSIKPLLRKEIYGYQKNQKNKLDDKKKILIIGGSQGAKFFDVFISKMIIKLSKTQNIKDPGCQVL